MGMFVGILFGFVLAALLTALKHLHADIQQLRQVISQMAREMVALKVKAHFEQMTSKIRDN